MNKIIFTVVSAISRPFKKLGLSKTRIGKFMYKKLFLPNKPDHINIEGFKLYLIHPKKDIFSDRMLMAKEYEPIETEVIKNLVKRGDVVIDVGANIGYYTVLLSRLVGDNGKVYSFEPGDECFNLLKKNCKENKCNNVILINKALSNKEGKIKFYINEQDKGNSSMIHTPTSKTIEVIVDATTLDKQIPEPIDFMKMDIEGAELKALIGGENLLKNCKQIIMEAPKERENFEEIKNLLIKNHYKIKRLDEGNILCIKKEVKK